MKRTNFTNLFVTFYRWQGKVYCLDAEKGIVEASKNSRGIKAQPVIKAAIADLADKADGKWCFSGKTGWIKIPLSVAELMLLPGGEEHITVNTRMNAITDINKYLKKQAKLFR